MSTLMKASRQWAMRPADERFVSLTELDAFVQQQKDRSVGRVVPSRALRAVPVDGDVQIQGSSGRAMLTHWAFSQISSLVSAPAAYLRELPAELAADNLNYGLHVKRGVSDVGVLLQRGFQGASDQTLPTLRAVTGPNYGRVWNASITRALVNHFGDGVTGHFRVPGEFGKRVEVTRENTTLYASDRDMFVFLADEDRRIEIPNRRDGKSGSLARGFFMWNSETGSQTFGIAFFLFDYVCCNRIVWGAQEYKEIRIRHSKSAPDRFIHEVAPVIENYASGSVRGITDTIAEAQKLKLKNDLADFLKNRFTSSQITGIRAAFMQEEQRPIETVWDVVTGATAYAKGIQYQDERVKVEREAGKLLAAVR